MPTLLNQIIKEYVDRAAPTDDFLKGKLVEKLEKDIRQEILKDEISLIEEQQKKVCNEIEMEFAKKRLQEKIEEADEIAFMAMFAGFIIGLLVNQITDLVSLIKNTLEMNSFQITLTVLVIFILSGIAWFCYRRIFIKKISKIISEKHQK